MIALKEPVFDKGPREWTPRIGSAVKKLEFLRALIPPEVVQVLESPESHWDSLTGKRMAVIFSVRARIWRKPWAPNESYPLQDNVWVTESGRIITESGIKELLTGNVEGYEHLAGRWEIWLLACEFSPKFLPRT